ncbi:Two component transcriptional regulator, LuxR family [Methylocella tundrae]|uniref:Two component transcriptional regulator, LuxR family n=1 Tax=Methylocella tundrae TaxID=227605 RepID=A0A8B6M324_METTU|nr:response regulator [Methylocella tundrae]VTZ27617.1 Two component transcriptional regulator, LuxR family [Methylocella tundrae]VTZ49441.1 Two component transcriptional regulator, LuxR family [Methylocella tundrae]
MDEAPNRRDKILTVDDTPDTLAFLTEALETAGLTVFAALDGESALGLLHEIMPDLVLMDAAMPGMDGFETCRRIKQEPHFSHLPVIFMTGLSETEHVLHGLACGGVDYVTKPIVVDELLARIKVHLANARIAYSARTALDATGRCLIATDEAGALLWCTPQAERMLAGGLLDGPRLDGAMAARLSHLRQDASTGAKSVTLQLGDRRIECLYLSRTGPNEFLYRLNEANQSDGAQLLKEAMTLTSREGEVLVWLAAGKSNRDISAILGISPRTVNKHLEQIFRKLGVENRAAAAAMAVRTLSARL